MKVKFSRKSLTVLISAGSLWAGIIFACAGGDYPEYGVSNFTPETFVRPAYSPFFYSDMFYYKIEHDENQNTRFNDENVKEWSAYLGLIISKKTIHFILESAKLSVIDSAVNYFLGKSAIWPVALKIYIPEEKRTDTKLSAFFKYLRLAKTSEQFAVNEIQYWQYDSSKAKNKYNANSLNEQLDSGFHHAEDDFLKQRYLFQLERSYFYNGNLQQAVDLFEKESTTMEKNILYYRIMAYVAGSFYKNKQFDKANYYFSLVYENCDLLKTTAHYSFHPQNEDDWQKTLALCKNTEEQITLWQMLGIRYADEARSIKVIYGLNPKSTKLDLLLSRAINKLEQKFDSGLHEYFAIKTDTNYVYDDSLKKLIFLIADEEKSDKPWIWDLAAGYTNTLDHRYNEANRYFKKALGTLPQDKPAQDQYRLLHLINTIAAKDKIDATFETSMIGEIDWLGSFKSSNRGDFRAEDAFAWLKQTFSDRFKLQGEPAKSECFVNNTAFFSVPQNLEAMKHLLSKENKTPFEELCTSLSEIKLNDIYEFEAIQYAYLDSTVLAIEKMTKAGESGETMLLGNPFNARILDCHDCDFIAAQKIKYSKISFLKKIQELKEKLAQNEDVYTNAMRLANAYYNLSQYGNARVFYECKILGSSHSNPMYIEKEYRPMLISQDLALNYYQRALDSARTNEQKAKCEYLMSKCERNQWYNLNVYNKEDNSAYESRMINVRDITRFDSLRRFQSTQYYKDIIRECGYFKSYVTKTTMPAKPVSHTSY